jgi:hypothetical protein
MTTTATADLNDLASRIAQTLREASEPSTNGLRDGEAEPRPEATERGIFMPWRPFGRLLILTGEWLRTIGGPGPTVPVSSDGGEARKFNWLGLLGVIFIAVGQWLLTQ